MKLEYLLEILEEDLEEILITGSTGFVGSHLIQGMKKNFQITGISKNETNSTDYKFHSIDITNPKFSFDNKFSKIIHTAALSDVGYCNSHPSECYETNVFATQKMLEFTRKNDSEFVFLSSSHVYGVPKQLPISESDICDPLNHYATSKKMSEILCKEYSKIYGLDIKIARIFSGYGPGSHASNLINKIFNQIIHDSKIVLGNLYPKRDFIFISDIVNGLIKIITSEKKRFEIYNIGTGKSTSIEDIAKICLKISKKDHRLVSSKEFNRENEIPEIFADISKMNSEFGWEPQVSLERGLETTYNYYKES